MSLWITLKEKTLAKRMAKGRSLQVIQNHYVGYGAELERVSQHINDRAKRWLLLIEAELEQEVYRRQTQKRTGLFQSLTTKKINNRQEATLQAVRATLNKYYRNIEGLTYTELRELARTEWQVSQKALSLGIGVNINLKPIPKALLEALGSDLLIRGQVQKKWWRRQNLNLQKRYQDALSLGLINNESNDELLDRILGRETGKSRIVEDGLGRRTAVPIRKGGVMQASRREALALIRTSVQTVSNHVRLESFKGLDVVKGMEAVVVLDGRTTHLCISRSRLAWDLEGKPIGHRQRWPGYPPWHWQCRTTLVPITKTFEELASPEKQRIGRLADRQNADMKRVQASMNGPVSSDLTYEAWLKTQSSEFQKQVLGAGKYRLWKNGKLKSLRQLLNQEGNPLSVRELQARYG